MRAQAELCVEGRGQIRRVVSAPPVTFRRARDAVYLVGTAAGPLADDDLAVRVEVCDGGSLKVRSAAATVVYAGVGSRQRFDILVGRCATLDWHPEPVIATAGCRHLQDVRINLAPDARLDWTEEVVLGRHGEQPGQIELRLHVDLAGRPLLRHQLAVGAPGWDGPAVLGGQRATGLRLVVDTSSPASTTGLGWAWLNLDGPARLLVAYGADLAELRRRMVEASRSSGFE
jgi:urease accessory protein